MSNFRICVEYLLSPNTVVESVNSVGSLWNFAKNHRGTAKILEFNIKSKIAIKKIMRTKGVYRKFKCS
jgi:hypothetical protein